MISRSEKYLVHALLVVPKLIDQAELIAKPNNFLSVGLNRVYSAILQLWRDGVEPDRALIHSALSATGKWNDEIGVLLDESKDEQLQLEMQPLKALQYAKAVKEAWLQRQAARLYQDGIYRIEQGDDPQIVVSEIAGEQDKLFDDIAEKSKNDSLNIGCENDKLIAERISGTAKRWTCGIPLVNEALPYFGRHDYCLITAYVRTGKTQLAIEAVAEPLAEGAGVLMFTLEADRYQVANRFISRYGNFPYRLLESGDIDQYPEDRARYETGREKFQSMHDHLRIYDHLYTIDSIFNEIKIQKKRMPVDFVIIDYAGLLHFKGERYDAFSKISQKIGEERKRLDINIILCQQISAHNMMEKTPGLIPSKETQQFAADADVCLHCEREDYESRTMKIWLMKNKRLGKLIHGDISYNRTWSRFVTLAEIERELPGTVKGTDQW